mgnify:FL=1
MRARCDPDFTLSLLLPGDNGAVTYELIAGVNRSRPEFGMFPDGSLYVAQKLDREVKDRYELMVKAKDAGSPLQRTATAMVHVSILDDNDNAPEFTSTKYEFEVTEGKETGTFIGLCDSVLSLIIGVSSVWLANFLMLS